MYAQEEIRALCAGLGGHFSFEYTKRVLDQRDNSQSESGLGLDHLDS